MNTLQILLQDQRVSFSVAGGCLLFLCLFLVCWTLYRKEKFRRRFLDLQLRYREEELADQRLTAESLSRTQHKHLQEIRDLAVDRARLQEALESCRAQQPQLEMVKRELEQEFQLLAERIFTEQAGSIRDQHRDGLQQMLGPVREQLHTFRNRVDDLHERSTRDLLGLSSELRQIRELNQQLSRDAVSLAGALKGENRLQGSWGEMILEKLLEDAGLREGREFRAQSCFSDGKTGRLRPDVVVHLPRGRSIVIDAKVSLAAYERACRAADKEMANSHLREHLLSVTRQVKLLSAKKYQEIDALESIDFVLLFLPVEGALQAAVTADPELLTKAMRQKVIICSPSSLLAILRTIQHLWRVDEQKNNAMEIAKQAGNLYDTFVRFAEAFEETGQRLEQAGRSWELARRRLIGGSGNLVQRVQQLRDLGVQPDRELPASLAGSRTVARPEESSGDDGDSI